MTSYRFWDMYICYKLNHVIGDNITLQIYIALYLKTQFKASEYITYLSDIYLELNWFVFCYSIAKEWTWVNVFYEMIGYCLNTCHLIELSTIRIGPQERNERW